MYAWLIEMDDGKTKIALSIDNAHRYIKSNLDERNLEIAYELNRFDEHEHEIVDKRMRIRYSNEYIHIARIDLV